jgi:hypothetical protein
VANKYLEMMDFTVSQTIGTLPDKSDLAPRHPLLLSRYHTLPLLLSIHQKPSSLRKVGDGKGME